jgi:SAM-dependent methyltransferase
MMARVPEHVPPELFEEDVYDHFYGEALEQGADAQARLIARLGDLRPGADVLDAPCGDGRIAARLAGMGCRVLGVDRSERFIARARRRPGAEGARFEVRDLLDLAYEAAFDCALNWFTSFGYFDAADNLALLRAYRRALRPGGRLVLEQRNPELLRRAVEAGGGTTAHVVDRGLDLLVDRVRLAGGRAHIERFVVRDGRVRKLEFSLAMFDAEALTTALREAGFADVRLVDEHGEPASPRSARLIAVARA